MGGVATRSKARPRKTKPKPKSKAKSVAGGVKKKPASASAWKYERYKTGKIGLREKGGRQICQIGKSTWTAEQTEEAAAELMEMLKNGCSAEEVVARRVEMMQS